MPRFYLLVPGAWYHGTTEPATPSAHRKTDRMNYAFFASFLGRKECGLPFALCFATGCATTARRGSLNPSPRSGIQRDDHARAGGCGGHRLQGQLRNRSDSGRFRRLRRRETAEDNQFFVCQREPAVPGRVAARSKAHFGVRARASASPGRCDAKTSGGRSC
jgi:hypothetical protein